MEMETLLKRHLHQRPNRNLNQKPNLSLSQLQLLNRKANLHQPLHLLPKSSVLLAPRLLQVLLFANVLVKQTSISNMLPVPDLLAERLELAHPVALADAQVEAPAGQQRQRRGVLGQAHGVVQR